MPTARFALAVSAIDGILYAVGGATLDPGLLCGLQTVEAYDPATNSWMPKPKMYLPRCGFSAGVVNQVLFAVGGAAGGPPFGVLFTDEVEAYQP